MTQKLEVRIKPVRDKDGDYFNYCSFHYHRGILTKEKAEECIAIFCRHYKRFVEIKE